MNHGKDGLVNIIEHHTAEHRGLLSIISNVFMTNTRLFDFKDCSSELGRSMKALILVE
jgi:hypothetical protein